MVGKAPVDVITPGYGRDSTAAVFGEEEVALGDTAEALKVHLERGGEVSVDTK